MAPPLDAVCVLVSFEGPDPYAQAGGLARRVQGLSEALAARGIPTHLVFVGDPTLPPREARHGVILHRWGQWISRHHPGGVYDGEDGKMRDLARSLPPFLVDHLITPAVAQGRVPIVLAEEWQTAEFCCRLAELLNLRQLGDRTILYWNANNPYGFDRIDWSALAAAARITTVSRYMRGILRARQVDSIVIPNGIPERLLSRVPDPGAVQQLHRTGGVFFKMARWEPEKGWDQALEAIARLRTRGLPAVLVARSGGPAGHGPGLADAAIRRGLAVVELLQPLREIGRQVQTITSGGAPVVSLRFPVDDGLARVLFAGADGVWANSVSEPFGLVGLEAMAAGGVVYTGGTGEDYAVSGRNAVVLESTDPGELARSAEQLSGDPERQQRLRDSARATARGFTWGAAVDRLLALVRADASRPNRSGAARGSPSRDPAPPRSPAASTPS